VEGGRAKLAYGSVPLLSSEAIPGEGQQQRVGLLWVGTRGAMTALLEARARARAQGTYADSSLARDGYDFLANDSSTVISRTGKWLTFWIKALSTQ
jgi:hypothetical protein